MENGGSGIEMSSPGEDKGMEDKGTEDKGIKDEGTEVGRRGMVGSEPSGMAAQRAGVDKSVLWASSRGGSAMN